MSSTILKSWVRVLLLHLALIMLVEQLVLVKNLSVSFTAIAASELRLLLIRIERGRHHCVALPLGEIQGLRLLMCRRHRHLVHVAFLKGWGLVRIVHGLRIDIRSSR